MNSIQKGVSKTLFSLNIWKQTLQWFLTSPLPENKKEVEIEANEFPQVYLLGLMWLQSLVQFSRTVMSDSLRPHGLQHARPPCLSLTPGAYSNSCPFSQWCHPTNLSSVLPFSSFLQSFPASGSFPMNQFFTSGGQTIGVSASASVLTMNTQDWIPSGWTGWISKGLSRVHSNTTVQKHQFSGAQLSL